MSTAAVAGSVGEQSPAILVDEYIPLVDYLVTEVALSASYAGPCDDLRRAGIEALGLVARRFDPEGRLTFSRYATAPVKAAIGRALAGLEPEQVTAGFSHMGGALGGADQAEAVVLEGAPADADIAGAWYDDLIEALAGLPADSAALLRAVYVDQLTAEDAAERFGVAPDEVPASCSAALRQLRSALDSAPAMPVARPLPAYAARF